MLKKSISLIFTFAFLLPLFAQKEGAIWYFGENAGLDFNSGAPVALNNGTHLIKEGSATMSDPNGNLLLYTDGTRVWNRFNQVMPNGSGLLGTSSSTQSGIIVPHPGNPDLYYVFTVDSFYHHNQQEGLNYNLVDLTLDGGKGDVVAGAKNIELLPISDEKLTAVKKSDTEYWVIAHHYDTFYTFRIDMAGIHPIPVETKLAPAIFGATDDNYGLNSAIGYMKISPDGSKLALVVLDKLYSLQSYGGVFLYDFDINTGLPSNPQSLSDMVDPYGLEFSPDSSKLYISRGFWRAYRESPNGHIYQFDLNAADIPASKTEVASLPPGDFYGALQLAIDGKIYFSKIKVFPSLLNLGSGFISVIENPNDSSTTLMISEDKISLDTGLGNWGLPTFIASYFNIGISYSNTCIGDTTEFSVYSSDPITSILWDFGDGTTSTVEEPSHMYVAPGSYTVQVSVSTTTETKSESKEITIYEVPVANPMTSIEVCNTTLNYELELPAKNSEILGGQSSVVYAVNYFASLADAQNHSGALPDLYTTSLATETIYAKIYNKDNPDCYDISSFDILVKQSPELNNVTDWTICDTDNDGHYNFDLSVKDPEILGGQNALDFEIRYFNSDINAQNDSGSIGANYTNTTPTEDIYFRIENTTYPECFETGSFRIEVVTEVVANTPEPLTVCDDNNDGFFEFNLAAVQTEVLGTQTPSSYDVTFHNNLQDADSGINQVDPNYNNQISYSEILYARVSNSNNAACYATTTLELIVYDTPVTNSITDWKVCDDDGDGLYLFDLATKDTEILADQSTNDFEVSYYWSAVDALSDQNRISNSINNQTNPQEIFYKIENRNNPACFVTSSFHLEFFATPTAYAPSDIILCDTQETGSYLVDLTRQNEAILNGQDPNFYQVTYYRTLSEAQDNLNPLDANQYRNNLPQEVIYSRVSNMMEESCYDIISFEIRINSLPEPDLQDRYVICPDSPDLIIDAGPFETYLWTNEDGLEVGSDRFLEITELGNYELTVGRSENGLLCENTVNFEVVSSGAPDTLSYSLDGFSDRIDLELQTTGTGQFEYSIDGVNYQQENQFEIFPGVYTIYVRDIYSCRILQEDILAIGYQKFFTPNGDGLHEHWNIIGAEKYVNSKVTIYDRYGKLIRQLSPTDPGWDGTYLGKPLPASDYWFRYAYDDGKSFTGHFVLKR